MIDGLSVSWSDSMKSQRIFCTLMECMAILNDYRSKLVCFLSENLVDDWSGSPFAAWLLCHLVWCVLQKEPYHTAFPIRKKLVVKKEKKHLQKKEKLL